MKKLLGESYRVLKDNNAILAGGAITSLFTRKPINDFDIYFRNEDDAISALHDCGSIHSMSKKAVITISNGKMIQLIYFKYFNTAHEIFESFDFTINMGAFDFATEQFVFHEDFFLHNTKRMLRFNPETAFPIVSALRIEKYTNRGFAIPATDNTNVMLACMNLKIETWGDFKEQAGGMYGTNLDEVFDFPDDEPFNLERAISILRNKELYEDDLKEMMINRLNNEGHIHALDKNMVEYRMSNTPVEFLETPRGYYGFRNDTFTIMLKNKDDIKPTDKIMPPKEFFKGRKVYKHVLKLDGQYLSFFDDDFEYKLGEEVFANKDKFKDSKEKLENRSKVNDSEKLYFYLRGDILSGYYAGKANGVILECLVQPDEFVEMTGDDKLSFLRCIPLREVSDAFIRGEEEESIGFTDFNKVDDESAEGDDSTEPHLTPITAPKAPRVVRKTPPAKIDDSTDFLF